MPILLQTVACISLERVQCYDCFRLCGCYVDFVTFLTILLLCLRIQAALH